MPCKPLLCIYTLPSNRLSQGTIPARAHSPAPPAPGLRRELLPPTCESQREGAESRSWRDPHTVPGLSSFTAEEVNRTNKRLYPKEPLPLALLCSTGQSSTLWACPAQESPDKSNSVSKPNSTDNLFRTIAHPVCSASLTPHGLTQMLHTPAGQI